MPDLRGPRCQFFPKKTCFLCSSEQPWPNGIFKIFKSHKFSIFLKIEIFHFWSQTGECGMTGPWPPHMLHTHYWDSRPWKLCILHSQLSKHVIFNKIFVFFCGHKTSKHQNFCSQSPFQIASGPTENVLGEKNFHHPVGVLFYFKKNIVF